MNPDAVIMSPDRARAAGLTSTVVFPVGNLAPEGSVIKATAIDPSVVDADNVYRHRGPARVFVDERDAIQAVKGLTERRVTSGDVIVLIGNGPSGTGMQETAQITTALKYLPWGKSVALITDGRFSGLSTGACIGHVGPEALDGGPIGRVRDGDLIEIVIDRESLSGSVNVVGANGERMPTKKCATCSLPAARIRRSSHTHRCLTTHVSGPRFSARAAARGPAVCTTSTGSSPHWRVCEHEAPSLCARRVARARRPFRIRGSLVGRRGESHGPACVARAHRSAR